MSDGIGVGVGVGSTPQSVSQSKPEGEDKMGEQIEIKIITLEKIEGMLSYLATEEKVPLKGRIEAMRALADILLRKDGK